MLCGFVYAGENPVTGLPRTNVTVSRLLDQYVEMSRWERTTCETYVGYIEKRIWPLLGKVKVSALDARVSDSFQAELRRCRDHCGRKRYVDHRTPRPHECDSRCRMHQCRPLGAATIRQIHFIFSGALKRAVRWRWVTTNPIIRAETPTGSEGPVIAHEQPHHEFRPLRTDVISSQREDHRDLINSARTTTERAGTTSQQ